MASEEQLRTRLESSNPFTRWRAERGLGKLGIRFVDPATVIPDAAYPMGPGLGTMEDTSLQDTELPEDIQVILDSLQSYRGT